MPQISGAPKELNNILEASYSNALKKYPGNKAKASKIAYEAAKNAGWTKGKDGKWMKKKKEMSEIVIDAFKEGTYPQGTFAAKELSEIASTYNPENYEAPILIGHLSDPSYKGKSSIPAYGWIGKAKVVGDHLKLVVSQFSDQLKEFIQQGFYKKVSAAFFQPDDPNNPTPGKWHLHHLAFLGGTPPAVKGLEGIAFAEMTLTGVEFAEMDTEISVNGEPIDIVEEVGTDDTIKDITESCATFIDKITETLSNDIDYDTQKSRCNLAAYDLNTEITGILNMHWMFQEKLENIEEHQENETEMSEKKGWLVKFAALITNKQTKRKEIEVDKQKEEEYQKQIAAKDAQIAEFAEKERLANEAKAKAEQDAKDAELKAAQELQQSEIKQFCETAIKENRMTPAIREKSEPLMFEMAKAGLKVKSKDKDGKEIEVPALKVFQEQFSSPIVPLGEVDLKDQKDDKRPHVIQQAEIYVKSHPKEFAGLSATDAVNRAIYLQSKSEIKFEDITKSKGAK